MVKLSIAETYIMNIIWKKKEITSFDVLARINIDKKMSKNTVRILLARMVKKGAIKVKEKIGKTYIYIPLLEKEEFQRKIAQDFLENIYNNDIKLMILNFFKDNKITLEDIEDVYNILLEISVKRKKK